MSKTMAVLDGQVVVNVLVCPSDEPETPSLVAYTEENPAVIGGDYVEGFFYYPQPYPSWTRYRGDWQPPVPYPSEGGPYTWDEDTLSWVEVESPI